MPCQVVFCLKDRHIGKINSHRWFLQAFGSILQPNICVFLDVGMRPGDESIYHLWKTFDLNSQIAGAFGEIVVPKGFMGKNLLNPLLAAQNFEYKMIHTMDKPRDSLFGFNAQFPSGFSAYRYIALQNNHLGSGPLASYFYGEVLQNGRAEAGIEGNMYLAEERVLCFEIITKRKCCWKLHFVRSAYAEMDVPRDMAEMISQRRRWLNGSLFTTVYIICHAFSIFRSGHGILRKLMFQVEILYHSISFILSWFSLVHNPYSESEIGKSVFDVCHYMQQYE